jgi:hypothetical protein
VIRLRRAAEVLLTLILVAGVTAIPFGMAVAIGLLLR